MHSAFEKVKCCVETNWHISESVAYLSESIDDHDLFDEANEEEEDEERATNKADQQFCALVRDVCGPFCVTGKLKLCDMMETYCDSSDNENSDGEDAADEMYDEQDGSMYYKGDVYKSSNMKTLNLEELLADAKLSPFGKGTETVIDTDVRHSYEIDVSNSHPFDPEYQVDLTAIAPDGSCIDVRPYKLVIYKEGGHFHEHRDTVRGENHIGTLVIILNSEYTGGELVVSHGGRTETVTGAYSWVAMYGDCLHKINPVTSGTRVSLIYDLYLTTPDIYHSPSHSGMWSTMYYNSIPLNSIPRGATEAQRAAVIAGMHQQLEGYEAAVISLKHLYPACQANPDFLKGGDQLLYEILSADFVLAVIPATIYRRKMDPWTDRTEENACCIKPFVNDLLPKEDIDLAVAAAQLRTKVIMVESLTFDHLIENEQIDYTGNEGQGEETVYLVAMLQVRRKEE